MERTSYREADSSLAGQQIPHLLLNPKSRYIVHSSLPLVPFVSRIYLCVISSFFREVEEMCALLGDYAAYSGNSLLMFRDNLSVKSSRVQKSWIGCLETSIRARSEPAGTRWRTGGEVKGKLANGVGSQYSHPTSELGLSSITQADAHTSAASRSPLSSSVCTSTTCPHPRTTSS